SDVEFVDLHCVVREDLLQEFGENAVTAFKEQVAVWRSWTDDDIAALFRLGAQVAVENTVDGVHRLRPAAEGKDGGIGLRRIETVGKDNFVIDRRPANLLA